MPQQRSILKSSLITLPSPAMALLDENSTIGSPNFYQRPTGQ